VVAAKTRCMEQGAPLPILEHVREPCHQAAPWWDGSILLLRSMWPLPDVARPALRHPRPAEVKRQAEAFCRVRQPIWGYGLISCQRRMHQLGEEVASNLVPAWVVESRLAHAGVERRPQ
jgi:hypothetical protein